MSEDFSLECFLRIEEQHNCFNRSVKGVKYWLPIREWLIMLLRKQLTGRGIQHPDLAISKTRAIPFNLIPSVLDDLARSWHALKVDKNCYDVVFIGSGKLIGQKEERHSEFLDPVLNKLPCSRCIISRPRGIIQEKFRAEASVIPSTLIEAKWYMRMLRQSQKAIEPFVVDIEPVLLALEESYGVELSRTQIQKRLAYIFAGDGVIVSELRKFFDKVKPKCIVEIAYYTTFNVFVNKVAHEYKIQVLEMQHGQIGKRHPAYNLPDCAESSSEYLPDKIAVFGDFWKQNSSFPNREERMVSTGSTVRESSLHRYTTKLASKEREIILIISQGYEEGLLSSLAIDLSDMVKDNYKVVFKLHPNEIKSWKQLHPALARPNHNVIVIDNSQKDLYWYLAQSACVIGVSSTSIFESIGIVETICVLKAEGSSVCLPLCDAGLATLVTNAEDVVSAMEHPSQSLHSEARESFWKSSASENLCKLIMQMTEGSL